MGTPISTLGNMHTCPMVEFLRPHIGGPIIGPGISGVLIQGKPVAVVGDECICMGGSKPDKIQTGCPGVLIDGKQVAWQGSQTAHGGVVSEGIPGITISGGFPLKTDNPGELEPKIFNLQWKKEDTIIKDSSFKNSVILSADTVGYEDGEEITIKVYFNRYNEEVEELKGIVKNNRVEIEWNISDAGSNEKKD